MKPAQHIIGGVSTPVQPVMVTILTITNALVVVNIYQCNSTAILTLFSKIPLDSMYQIIVQYSLIGIILQIVFICINILNKKKSDLLLSFSQYYLVCYISQFTFKQWYLNCFWFINFPMELGSGGAGRMPFEERRLHKVVSSGASATSWSLVGRCIMSCMVFLFSHCSIARLHRDHLEMQSEFF